MRIIRYVIKDRFSFFDVTVAGLVVAAVFNDDYWFAAGVFVVGSCLSGFLTAATKAT